MEENIWNSAFAENPAPIEEKQEEVSDQLSEDLSILISLGKLQTSFDFWGHNFTMTTLKINEELQAFSLATPYKDTIDGGARALTIALVAAALENVDGVPLVNALGPNDITVIPRKFQYILENYYWELVENLYSKYNELMKRVSDATEELKKK